MLRGVRPTSALTGGASIPPVTIVLLATDSDGLFNDVDAALASDPLFGIGCGWAFQSGEWLAAVVVSPSSRPLGSSDSDEMRPTRLPSVCAAEANASRGVIEPSVSVPTATAHKPAATAAAEPELLPEGDRDSACGLRVWPPLLRPTFFITGV